VSVVDLFELLGCDEVEHTVKAVVVDQSTQLAVAYSTSAMGL